MSWDSNCRRLHVDCNHALTCWHSVSDCNQTGLLTTHAMSAATLLALPVHVGRTASLTAGPGQSAPISTQVVLLAGVDHAPHSAPLALTMLFPLCCCHKPHAPVMTSNIHCLLLARTTPSSACAADPLQQRTHALLWMTFDFPCLNLPLQALMCPPALPHHQPAPSLLQPQQQQEVHHPLQQRQRQQPPHLHANSSNSRAQS